MQSGMTVSSITTIIGHVVLQFSDSESGARWRFRLYWRARWFSKYARFQEFILGFGVWAFGVYMNSLNSPALRP